MDAQIVALDTWKERKGEGNEVVLFFVFCLFCLFLSFFFGNLEGKGKGMGFGCFFLLVRWL